MIDAQAALAAAHSALQTVADAFAEQGVTLSKLSLERDALAEANIALQAQLDTANQTIAVLTDPWREVDKSGLVDVTAKVQAILDRGGVSKMPAGRYLIDPVAGLKVRAGSTLNMALDTVLVVKPNAASRYAALTVESDATVDGGVIWGERLLHDYSSGGTHEWGYGVKVAGDRAKVSNLTVVECTGDGVIVSGDDVTLTRVVSLRNRRQGMSVFAAKGLRCIECEFGETGAFEGNPGTAPQAGVDIEPDSGAADDLEFRDCIIRDNATSGLLMWTRSGTGASVTNVRLIGGKVYGNPNGVNAKSLSGIPITATVEGCEIKRGSGSGIRADAGSVFTVNGNTFSTPTDRTDFTLTGTDTRTRYDIAVLTGGAVSVGTNRYV